MNKYVDLDGKRFGMWTIVGPPENRKSVLYWNCRCDCGNSKFVFGGDLKRGMSTGCGCARSAKRAAQATSHGMSFHPAYGSWVNLRGRCENPKNDSYYLYGARGIKVCARWATFEHFWEDMGGTWFDGASIDRKDTNGNYEPGNCRWTTPKQQAMNRRTNRIINTPAGPMPIMAAAEKYGLTYQTIASRLRYGWPEDEYLVQPPLWSKRS